MTAQHRIGAAMISAMCGCIALFLLMKMVAAVCFLTAGAFLFRVKTNG